MSEVLEPVQSAPDSSESCLRRESGLVTTASQFGAPASSHAMSAGGAPSDSHAQSGPTHSNGDLSRSRSGSRRRSNGEPPRFNG